MKDSTNVGCVQLQCGLQDCCPPAQHTKPLARFPPLMQEQPRLAVLSCSHTLAGVLPCAVPHTSCEQRLREQEAVKWAGWESSANFVPIELQTICRQEWFLQTPSPS